MALTGGVLPESKETVYTDRRSSGGSSVTAVPDAERARSVGGRG
jgi:hypothetical protein